MNGNKETLEKYRKIVTVSWKSCKLQHGAKLCHLIENTAPHPVSQTSNIPITAVGDFSFACYVYVYFFCVIFLKLG